MAVGGKPESGWAASAQPALQQAHVDRRHPRIRRVQGRSPAERPIDVAGGERRLGRGERERHRILGFQGGEQIGEVEVQLLVDQRGVRRWLKISTTPSGVQEIRPEGR